MNKEDKIKNLERIDLWINNADTKISYLFAFIGIIATIFFTNNTIVEKIKQYINNVTMFSKQDIMNIVSLINIVLVMSLIFFLIRCIYYLLKASNANISDNHENDKSTMFFGAISKYKTLNEFKEIVKKQKEEEFEEEVLAQIYINSKICNEKLKNYNKSMKNLKILLIILLVIIVNMVII